MIGKDLVHADLPVPGPRDERPGLSPYMETTVTEPEPFAEGAAVPEPTEAVIEAGEDVATPDAEETAAE